jgi:hypothetical protein
MRHTILIAATCVLLVPVAGVAQPRKPDVPGVRVEMTSADGKAGGHFNPVPVGGRLTVEVLARDVSLGEAPEGAGDRIACGVIRR